jgi:hypothetical protein
MVFLRRRVVLSAIGATALLMATTFATVQCMHRLESGHMVSQAIATLAMPGITVGALIDLISSRNIHGSGSTGRCSWLAYP